MDSEHLARVWEIIEKVGVCMFTTQSPSGLRARPLDARPNRDGGLIYFITDIRGRKDDEIDVEDDVGMTFVDAGSKAYLSITARAEILHDQTLATTCWRKSDAVWWPDGPTDPNVRVLRVTPMVAELWDGPASAAVAAFEFAKARATGNKPKLGEKRKITLNM